jgi:penicillin amidase
MDLAGENESSVDLDRGSNNWVLSGVKTKSGHPIMANDPHRRIAIPSLRYAVHLVAQGWNVIGGGEPEIPGVSIGHNEYGAWGLTIFSTDGEDLYIYDLNPQNLSQYRYRGKWEDMQEIKESIPIKNDSPRMITLRYTRHGPVTYIDSLNRKAYAVRCAWLEPGGAPYLASLRMDQAKSWEEFREACSFSNIPAENMVWADQKGNIGWQAVGITPVRKNFSGLVPVPGDGTYEWGGYLPIKERPSIHNPASGFFATANEHVTPKDYQHTNTQNYLWADPFRGQRINEVLSGENLFSLEDIKDLQSDYYSIPARTLVPMLEDLQMPSREDKDARDTVLKWNYKLTTGSVGAGIYAMWERTLKEEAEKRFIPKEAEGLIDIQLHKIIEWLRVGGENFGPRDREDKAEFLRSTFTAAIAILEGKLGEEMTEWKYGQEAYKHSTMSHMLSSFVDEQLRHKINAGPHPRGGNSYTPNSTGNEDNQGSGASFKFITDVGDWDKALMINTPGQSGDPASPYYKNIFKLWATNQYFPAYYSREKVEEVTREVLILNPEN